MRRKNKRKILLVIHISVMLPILLRHFFFVGLIGIGIERGIIACLQKRETDNVKNYIFNPGVNDPFVVVVATNFVTFLLNRFFSDDALHVCT